MAEPHVRLEPRLVGEISERFFVPAYQRGYRWGELEVRSLLDDIWEGRGSPYYLQPIVVKKRPDGALELVDGQQRLTTLYLIFQYMWLERLQNAGATYSIEYETRPGSAGYLEEPTAAKSEDNIDYFHIFGAYRCIQQWSARTRQAPVRREPVLRGALFEDVKVIWYRGTRRRQRERPLRGGSTSGEFR